MPEIYDRLSKVMEDVGAIRKGQKNEFDRYNFRGIDDVYNAVQPALVKHGVLIVPEVTNCSMDAYETAKGAIMQRAILTIAYHFWAPDGSEVVTTVVGEGADRGDKAINKAHSSAYKNALFQTLCIPTEEKSDSEFSSPEGQAVKPEKEQPSPKPNRPDPSTPIRPSAIGERLMVAMRGRCAELGLNPEDTARGALAAICASLNVTKTAAELTKNCRMILDHIETWQPPGGDLGDDFASGSNPPPTLGDAPKEMSAIHVWVGEEIGHRDKKAAHDALHAALPHPYESLRDLPISMVGELKERVRAADGKGA